MPDIYDEALADRKKLLEVAENNAKNKLISAVTPRIKEMVESALLGKLNEMPEDDSILLDSELGTQEGTPDIASVTAMVDIDGALAGESPESGEGPLDFQTTNEDGEMVLSLDSVGKKGNSAVGEFMLTPESVRALNSLVGTPVVNVDEVSLRLSKMETRLKQLVESKSPSIKDIEYARQIKLECKKLYANVQASREVLDESQVSKIENRLENIFKQVMENYSIAGHLNVIIEEMHAINVRAAKVNKLITESNRLSTTTVDSVAQMLRETMDLHTIVGKLEESLKSDDSTDLATVRGVGANLEKLYTEIRKMATNKFGRITEADEAEDLDTGLEDMGGDLDAIGPEEDGAGLDDAGVDDMGGEEVLVKLSGFPANLKAGDTGSVTFTAEPAEAEVGEGEFEELGPGAEGEDEMGLDDMGGEPEEELPMESRLRDDDIIEIDEAALVNEMRKMKKLREKKEGKVGSAGIKNVNTGGHGPAHFDAFGGGHEEGEPFVDGEELNKSDPLGSSGYLEEADGCDEEELDEDYGNSSRSSARKSKESYGESRFRGQKVERNNRRSNEAQLAEAYNDARVKLADQKLFNTKLIALNRVLQVPSLNRVQKEKVVEILDKGRTVAEVKQLYSRIIESLKKSNKMIKESAQHSGGSASRVTTSTSPTNTDDQHPLLEKWQKIAFGNGGVIKG